MYRSAPELVTTSQFFLFRSPAELPHAPAHAGECREPADGSHRFAVAAIGDRPALPLIAARDAPSGSPAAPPDRLQIPPHLHMRFRPPLPPGCAASGDTRRQESSDRVPPHYPASRT